MSKLVHLQGMGDYPGIPAGELKPGMVMVWNYGGLERTTGEIQLSKTGKTLTVETEYRDYDGTIKPHVRKFKTTRLVVVTKQKF